MEAVDGIRWPQPVLSRWKPGQRSGSRPKDRLNFCSCWSATATAAHAYAGDDEGTHCKVRTRASIPRAGSAQKICVREWAAAGKHRIGLYDMISYQEITSWRPDRLRKAGGERKGSGAHVPWIVEVEKT